MSRVRAFVVIATLVIAGLLAGCGSSSQSSSRRVSAQAYTKSLCSAVIPFERAVVSHSALLSAASPNDPTKSKQALESFFSAVSQDTGTAVTRLRQAGTPDVQDGDRISGAINAAFTQLQTAMSQAATQSKSLSTNPSTFRSGAATLSNNFRASMNRISQSLQSNALRSPALQQAAKRTAACQTTSGGS